MASLLTLFLCLPSAERTDLQHRGQFYTVLRTEPKAGVLIRQVLYHSSSTLVRFTCLPPHLQTEPSLERAEFYPFRYMCCPLPRPRTQFILTQQEPSKWLLRGETRVRGTLDVHYLWSSPVMAANSELFPQPTFPTMPTSIPCKEATR